MSTKIAFRSDKGISILKDKDTQEYFERLTSRVSLNNSKSFKYSQNGNILGIIQNQIVVLNKLSINLSTPVLDISYSPLGTWVVIYEKYVKTETGEPNHNVTMWDTESGEMVWSWFQKLPTIGEWSEDEKYYARIVNSTVSVWNLSDQENFKKITPSVLKVDNLSSFSISPGLDPILAVFSLNKNDSPASIRIFKIGNLSSQITQKAFYRADSVQFKWNSVGTHLLAFTHTDMDATGQSYYGETNVYYMDKLGKINCRIDFDKSGPIHDLAWNPNGREFVVVYGTMPSKATLFDHRGIPIYEFGEAARNTVKFNQKGRLLFIGGFGNLSGEIDVWDRKGFQKLATFQASNSSSCEWSPDGKHILTSTLYKRLKVDNGFKIWHYSGALIHQTDVKEMYQVEWEPCLEDIWPDRTGQSPPPVGIAIAKAAAVKPVGAYRPPGARSGNDSPVERATLASLSSNLKTARSIPGLNKYARGNKQSAKESPRGNRHVAKEARTIEKSTTDTPASAGLVSKDPEKRIKVLKKKLKQIQDIREKLDVGEHVELTQIQKLEAEAEILKELNELTLGS